MRRQRRKGLTLIELMIVIAIIMLLSVATLPTVITVLNRQEMTNAVQLVQSTLAGVRDTSIRAGEPRGVRLIPDPVMAPGGLTADAPHGGRVASNRLIFLEPAPNYSEGRVIAEYWTPNPSAYPDLQLLRVREAKRDADGLPLPPTGWYYNIRQGDKIRLGGAGHEYTIIGPFHDFSIAGLPASEFNADRAVNLGSGFQSMPHDPNTFEFLILTNGINDDAHIRGVHPVTGQELPRDGYIDEMFDGINNDGSDLGPDPAFPGPDNQIRPIQLMLAGWNPDIPGSGQYEQERFIGSVPLGEPIPYSIRRRPVPSLNGREVALPGDVVIDLTTAITLGPRAERSRVPIDPATGFVDIVIYPNGQVIPSTPFGNAEELTAYPFYHLWLTKREEVHEPLAGPYPRLPLPAGIANPRMNLNSLRGDRRLITISTRTGRTSTDALPDASFFPVNDPDSMYRDAEQGH